jgi:hypothetical protein
MSGGEFRSYTRGEFLERGERQRTIADLIDKRARTELRKVKNQPSPRANLARKWHAHAGKCPSG